MVCFILVVQDSFFFLVGCVYSLEESLLRAFLVMDVNKLELNHAWNGKAGKLEFGNGLCF